MGKTAVDKLKKRAPGARVASLGPGVHPARIDLRAGDRYSVHTFAGERTEARLARGVEEALAEECLREQRTVLVTQGEDGVPVILGALQTARGASPGAGGAARPCGKRVEIRAEEGLVLRVGQAALVMEKDGTVKIVGQKMSMNLAEVVRVLSTRCELP
jgi:hypothetical protein